ncbi:hypothetical protein F5Y02DRAFT_404404 [Annulohypoxylon stygium]|nr:hypothetical protein F5Y02DRAFT_404404 [Annulohypoxylon stygium]
MLSTSVIILLVGLLSGNSIAAPAKVKGADCTNGIVDGFCNADGLCNLQLGGGNNLPESIPGQCGQSDDTNNLSLGSGNASADNSDTGSDSNGTSGSSQAGDACSDGTLDGVCRDDGFCNLDLGGGNFLPKQLSGQCGQ